MKRLNHNCYVFILAVIFIALGYNQQYFRSLTYAVKGFENGFNYDFIGSFITLKDNIEDISDKQVRYHDKLLDLNSVKENLLGTRVIIKSDTTVVKAESGSLIIPSPPKKKEEIAEVVARIAQLKEFAEENGAKFLYCAAPVKAMYEKEPANVLNASSDSMDTFLADLQEEGIPYIDFREMFEKSNIDSKDIFYYTDHHWTVRSGLLAAQNICEKLNKLYGFKYDKRYTDIQNYKVTLLDNWFLGSYGKKVGRFFSWKGADDFEVIVPDFETNMTEERPYINEFRIGPFENTVMFPEKLEKNYYGQNTYAAYSGGDFHLQIMRNNMIKDGKKMLLIRDSYSCVVAPFLSLQTKELSVCDMREADYIEGIRIDLKDYIIKTKPDYVIVLYTRVGSVKDARKYDFLE